MASNATLSTLSILTSRRCRVWLNNFELNNINSVDIQKEEREEEEVYQEAFKNAERIVQDLKSDKKRVEKSLSMSKESGLSEQVRGDIHSLTAYLAVKRQSNDVASLRSTKVCGGSSTRGRRRRSLKKLEVPIRSWTTRSSREL